jgi:hypothetical protein
MSRGKSQMQEENERRLGVRQTTRKCVCFTEGLISIGGYSWSPNRPDINSSKASYSLQSRLKGLWGGLRRLSGRNWGLVDTHFGHPGIS